MTYNTKEVKFFVQYSERSIVIQKSNYLGLTWVFVQHACNKLAVIQRRWMSKQLEWMCAVRRLLWRHRWWWK